MDKGLRIIRNVLVIVAFLTLRSPETAAADSCSIEHYDGASCMNCNWADCFESICVYDSGPNTYITSCA